MLNLKDIKKWSLIEPLNKLPFEAGDVHRKFSSSVPFSVFLDDLDGDLDNRFLAHFGPGYQELKFKALSCGHIRIEFEDGGYVSVFDYSPPEVEVMSDGERYTELVPQQSSVHPDVEEAIYKMRQNEMRNNQVIQTMMAQQMKDQQRMEEFYASQQEEDPTLETSPPTPAPPNGGSGGDDAQE